MKLRVSAALAPGLARALPLLYPMRLIDLLDNWSDCPGCWRPHG